MCLFPYISIILPILASCSMPICDNPVFCDGNLLKVVQISGIFNDSKTFVDLQLTEEPEKVLATWQRLMKVAKNAPKAEQIREFIKDNFFYDNDLIPWNPEEPHSLPKFLNQIPDAEIRKFATSLITNWSKYTRKISEDVRTYPNRSTMLALEYGFIIPGGRLRELHYRDAFWLIKGLLISNMLETTREILDNFISLIKQFGFVPASSRIYHQRRSQSPLFAPMCRNYMKISRNFTWLENNIRYIEIDLLYWMDFRTIVVNKDNMEYILARYIPDIEGRRPEAYREDKMHAGQYLEINAMAESGWVASSRWYNTNSTILRTTKILPVDLNSYLYKSASDFSHLLLDIGQLTKAALWHWRAEQLKTAINKILWNNIDGVWYDYDIQEGAHRKQFSVANITPLWAGIFSDPRLDAKHRMLDYLRRSGALDCPGGVPATMRQTGLDWDYPNGWAPLQWVMVEGLLNLKLPAATSIAEGIARKWVRNVYESFKKNGMVYEKYDVTMIGVAGAGGEKQSGSVWTNGVVLDFIYKYYRK